MIQTEAHRQFYLGMAGIQQWYARNPLPGAAPSPEFRFPVLEEPAPEPVADSGKVANESAAVSAKTSQRSVKPIASLQALMDTPETAPKARGKASMPRKEADVEATPSVESVTEAPLEEGVSNSLHLHLGVFTGIQFVLVANISGEASLRLQQTLADNILKAVGERQTTPVEWVHWPVFNNRLVPGNSMDNLASTMRYVFRDLRGKKVIVLGRNGTVDTDYAGNWLADSLGRSLDVEHQVSLAELATNPALKRSLWHQLKPLVMA